MLDIKGEGNQSGLHPTLRTNNNSFVNPWPAVQVDNQGSILLPSINILSRPVIEEVHQASTTILPY